MFCENNCTCRCILSLSIKNSRNTAHNELSSFHLLICAPSAHVLNFLMGKEGLKGRKEGRKGGRGRRREKERQSSCSQGICSCDGYGKVWGQEGTSSGRVNTSRLEFELFRAELLPAGDWGIGSNADPHTVWNFIPWITIHLLKTSCWLNQCICIISLD